LGDLRVRQFIGSPTFPTLQPEDSLATVMSRLAAESYPVLPVTNADGRLLGVVSLEEVHLASQSPHIQSLVIAEDLMRSDIIPLRPDDRLDQALEMFVDSGLMVLPVVDGTPEQRVVGLVNRSDLSRLYLRSVQGATARSDEPAQLL
jgi:CBS domain-containing protein